MVLQLHLRGEESIAVDHQDHIKNHWRSSPTPGKHSVHWLMKRAKKIVSNYSHPGHPLFSTFPLMDRKTKRQKFPHSCKAWARLHLPTHTCCTLLLYIIPVPFYSCPLPPLVFFHFYLYFMSIYITYMLWQELSITFCCIGICSDGKESIWHFSFIIQFHSFDAQIYTYIQHKKPKTLNAEVCPNYACMYKYFAIMTFLNEWKV